MRNFFMGVVMTLTVCGSFVEVVSAKEASKPEAVQLKDVKVNINTANAQQIAKALVGIGMKKAEAIVAYRTQNGPFKSSADLLKVKGFGSETLKKNENLITLN